MTARSHADPGEARVPDAVKDATAIEKADVEVTRAVAPYRKSLPVRTLGTLSDLSDQPPLISICAGTAAWGILSADARLTRVGTRMLAAELVGIAIKSAVKRLVDRTRPKLLVEEGRYDLSKGSVDEHPVNSFPSGHTTGAVAVARAVVRDYPEHRAVAYTLAAAAAAIQVPRCTHYPSDLAGGAVAGIAAEWMASAAINALWPSSAA